MRRDFYVYLLFRPDGRPCYIGKGKGNRWTHHEKWTGNPHLRRIIKNAGGSIPKEKIRDNLTEDEAFNLEIELIRSFGRIKDGGPLVNMTDGGDGLKGCDKSIRKKMSRKAHQRWNGEGNEAARMAVSKVHSGKTLSEEHKAIISAANLGKKRPSSVGIKISQALKGRVFSEETRRRMSISAKRRTDRNGPCTNKRRTAIQKALIAFWAQRRKDARQSGKPLARLGWE